MIESSELSEYSLHSCYDERLVCFSACTCQRTGRLVLQPISFDEVPESSAG